MEKALRMSWMSCSGSVCRVEVYERYMNVRVGRGTSLSRARCRVELATNTTSTNSRDCHVLILPSQPDVTLRFGVQYHWYEGSAQ